MKKLLAILILLSFTTHAFAGEVLTKITGTTVATGDDYLYIVDDPGGTPASRYISKSDLFQDITTNTISANTVQSSFVYSDNTIGADGEVTGSTVRADSVTANSISGNTITDGDFSTTGGVITGATEVNWDAAFTHVSNDGSDHSFINQSVISGSSPTFDGANFTGNISVWTNNSGYLTAASEYWEEYGGTSIIRPVTATVISSNTVFSSVMYSDNTIGCEEQITSSSVSANTISVGGDYEFAIGDPADNQLQKYDAGLGKMMWESDVTGAGASTDSLDTVVGRGASTETELDLADVGLDRLTATTVTSRTVLGGNIYSDTSIGTDAIVTGATVSGNVVKADIMTFPKYDTIQFTIEQPDQLDTSDMLTVWSNDTELDFNIVEVKGWSDTQYDVILGHTTNIGSDEGVLANFSVATAGVSLYYGSNTSVSHSVVTTNTIYFDATDWAPNHIKVTIKGYWN